MPEKNSSGAIFLVGTVEPVETGEPGEHLAITGERKRKRTELSVVVVRSNHLLVGW